MMKSKALLSLAVLCTFRSVHHPMPYYFFSWTEDFPFPLSNGNTEVGAHLTQTLDRATDTGHEQNWKAKSSSNRLSTKTTDYQAATPGEDSNSILVWQDHSLYTKELSREHWRLACTRSPTSSLDHQHPCGLLWSAWAPSCLKKAPASL